MPRDRKAIEARKKRARQEAQRAEKISKQNAYGFSDPTAYLAIKKIMQEKQ